MAAQHKIKAKQRQRYTAKDTDTFTAQEQRKKTIRKTFREGEESKKGEEEEGNRLPGADRD